MLSFFAIYFLIYGGVNIMFALKARAAFSLGLYGGASLSGWCALMMMGPLVVRALEGRLEFAATVIAYLSYFWMGLMLIFFSVALVMDVYSLLVYLIKFISKNDLSRWTLSSRVAFIVPAILAALINAYGFYAAWDIKAKHLDIKTSKLPQGMSKFRIVQISDVHLGPIVGPRKLDKIVRLVREAKPDLFVSTGDLVDGAKDNISEMAAQLSPVTAPYGKYAVTGNHELYAGMDRSIAFTRSSGFRVLIDESVEILQTGITIVGVDYRRGGWEPGTDDKKPVAEGALIRSAPGNGFKLVLKHLPRVLDESIGAFDLQLSGHVHGGQIFPFKYATRLVFKHIAGLYELGSGSELYVSRGTGTWGPPVRFLSPPEVTVIDLVKP